MFYITLMKELALTPSIEQLPPLTRRKNKTCTLILTRSCNLNCSYCYEHFKTEHSMNFVTAQRCVSEQMNLVRQDPRFSWLLVELFGGEPLLNFELIKKLVPWARPRAQVCPTMFMVITNGTLLNDEMKEWFRQNKDMVVLTVSYDGSTSAQHQNRGCFSESALEFCRCEWPDMSFRMTVSPATVSTVAKDIRTATEKGYSLRAQLANGVSWSHEDAITLEAQLRELKQFYIEFPQVIPTLLEPFFKGGEDSDAPCSQRCGAGMLKVCYDVDGVLYPCSMFSPVCAGKRARVFADYRPERLEYHNDPYCQGCPIKHTCYTCPASNFINRGFPGFRDHGRCQVNLTQALVTLEYQAEFLVKQGLSPQSAALLKSLLRIYRKIKVALVAFSTDENFPGK